MSASCSASSVPPYDQPNWVHISQPGVGSVFCGSPNWPFSSGLGSVHSLLFSQTEVFGDFLWTHFVFFSLPYLCLGCFLFQKTEFISLSHRGRQSSVRPLWSSQYHLLYGMTTTTCPPPPPQDCTFLSYVCASVVISFPWTINSLRVGLCLHQLRASEPQPIFSQAGPALGPAWAQPQHPLLGLPSGAESFEPARVLHLHRQAVSIVLSHCCAVWLASRPVSLWTSGHVSEKWSFISQVWFISWTLEVLNMSVTSC